VCDECSEGRLPLEFVCRTNWSIRRENRAYTQVRALCGLVKVEVSPAKIQIVLVEMYLGSALNLHLHTRDGLWAWVEVSEV
jgi:hypothetical protein